MKNNFGCRYKSIGETYCFYNDGEIGLNGVECHNCELDNECEYCDWEISHPENCINCTLKEG